MLEDPVFFILALAWSPVFLGGTMGILFSRGASWKVRRHWAMWSMLAPAAAVIIGLILFGWADNAVATRIGIVVMLITPIANWLTFKRFKARISGTPVMADAATLAPSRSPSSSLTLAWIVLAIGLFLSVKSVFFAVEMFYGGPWVDPFYAHYMGVAAVLLGAAVLWAGVHMLRTGFARRAQARRTRSAA